MLEQTLVVGPFQCNCRLIACPVTGEAILVDPGDEPARILKAIEGARVKSGAPVQVKFLLHTHAHLDHVAGTRGVKEGLSAQVGLPLAHADAQSQAPKIALHREDELLYQNLVVQGQFFGMDLKDPLPVDHYLEHEQVLHIGKLKLSMIHTPGHSPGSLCIRLHEDSEAGTRETIFSGDTLFQGSVGRTDLWGADQDAMFRNIHSRILTLDGDTRVCPGHGPDTTVEREKRTNPFLS